MDGSPGSESGERARSLPACGNGMCPLFRVRQQPVVLRRVLLVIRRRGGIIGVGVSASRNGSISLARPLTPLNVSKVFHYAVATHARDVQGTAAESVGLRLLCETYRPMPLNTRWARSVTGSTYGFSHAASRCFPTMTFFAPAVRKVVWQILIQRDVFRLRRAPARRQKSM